MRLYVPLTRQEYEALEQLAFEERRRPQDQAAFLLAQTLADKGTFQPRPTKTPDSTAQRSAAAMRRQVQPPSVAPYDTTREEVGRSLPPEASPWWPIVLILAEIAAEIGRRVDEEHCTERRDAADADQAA